MYKPADLLVLWLSLLTGVIPTLLRAGGNCGACQVDTSFLCYGQFGAVCPDTLGPASAGTSVDENLTFFMPAQVAIDRIVLPQPLTIPIVNLTVDTIKLGDFIVVGLYGVTLDSVKAPQGLSYTCDGGMAGPCSYAPDTLNPASQFGCVNLCGMLCGFSGAHNVQLFFTLYLDLTQIDLAQAPFPFNLIPSGLLPDTVRVNYNLRSVFLIDRGVTPAAILTEPATNYLCPGDSIKAYVPGFTAYSWSSGQTDDSVFIKQPGLVTVAVTDSSGCVQQVSAEFRNLEAMAGNDTVICPYQVIRLHGSGGNTYLWQPATNLSEPAIADPVVFGLTQTKRFFLTVSNGQCTHTDSIEVIIDSFRCMYPCSSFCTVNHQGCTTSGPAVCQLRLPEALTGQDYLASFSFFLPDTLGAQLLLSRANIPDIQIPGFGNLRDLLRFVPDIPVPVRTYRLLLDGLPEGFFWQSDQAGNQHTYYPGMYPPVTSYGCITLCGEQVCAQGGTYRIKVIAEVLFTIPLPFQIPLPGFEGFRSQITMETLLPVRSIDGDLVIQTQAILPGRDDSLIVQVPDRFASYLWSTGDTTPAIIVGTSGVYAVTAVDHSGCPQSDTIIISPATAVASPVHLEEEIYLFPNPVRDEIEMLATLGFPQLMQVDVFTSQGYPVHRMSFDGYAGINRIHLPFQELPAGVYLVKIILQGKSFVRKVIRL
ncbi:MAG: hypothetical protein KatS3mg031_1310 [Chitinophagales bacterium]|nr:MAG: hypothetical protein KatS3mg031_1310 [Chitinophagales bacterium]